MVENEITGIVVDKCIKIHKLLGPGLLESVYEEALSAELTVCQLNHKRQLGIPVVYEDKQLDLGFRADIVIEGKVIIEIKSIEAIAPVHQKQLLTYLRLSRLKLGLLINFNVALIKDGIHRIVNNL